ncbi:MAG: c-type cytochrome, partial [Planctomycetia bacterium]
LTAWRGLTPAVRDEASQALLGRKEWTLPLLDAVAAGKVPAGQIDPVRRDLLLKSADETIRNRSASLFGASAPSARADVLKAYQPALAAKPDKVRGAAVFERECSSCHQVQGKGYAVGPNLATIKTRTPAALMLQILDPNVEVLPNFVDYVVALDDGRVATGLIAGESATSVTLKRARGAEDVILRQNIDEMTSTGKSLMPEGLEQKIAVQEMADLLAYLLDAPTN